MRIAKRYMAVISALLFVVALLAACQTASPAATPSPDVAAAGTSAAAETPAAAPAMDPFGKYDPPITIHTIRILDNTVKFVSGEDINNNAWSKAYADELGITVVYDWIASTSDQYDDKLNVNIASGMIPDVMTVNRSQLARLVKTDLINMDVTQAYEQYASPLLKEIMTQEGTAALDSATFDGKLVALPSTGSSMDSAAMMWIRKDWLQKFNLQAPTTIAELENLIDVFTTQDPDGTGAKDYVGMAMTKDIYSGGFADMTGFFNAYHAYPTVWIKDASGKLVYGSYQPEMKAALLELQKLYAAGKIDPEFSVKDGGKEAELCSAGKCGIEFGAMWNPFWPLQTTKDNNPASDWTAYALPSVDGQPAQPQVSLSVTDYFVCSKGFANPEAIVKLYNLYVQKGWGGTLEDTLTYFSDTVNDERYEFFKYALVQGGPATKNLDNYHAFSEALKTGDTSKLTPEAQGGYESLKAYQGGDNTQWSMWAAFGSGDSSFRIIDQYVKGNMLMMNAFFGADTDTMQTKKAALDKLELETFTKIIMGESIDTFDEFVQNAMSLGGNDIEKEVNDWYAAMKG
jgi:putative aldouronate transport system substrate-binding protein